MFMWVVLRVDVTMATSSHREEIEAIISDLSYPERRRVYGRTQLTPFEECAVFGYGSCPVSHPKLARDSSRRGGALCEYFSRLSTTELEGERYEYEVEYELGETDARGNTVTTTKLEAGTIEWPVVRTKSVDKHAGDRISLQDWFERGPTQDSFTIGWSQVNRGRDFAAKFSEGKVVHGTLPDYNDEHVLVQTEPLITSKPAFHQFAMREVGQVDDEEIVDALILDDEFINRYDQHGRSPDRIDVNYLDFLDV